MVTEPDRIAGYVRNGAYGPQGLGMLAQQFQGKAKIAALLSPWLAELQAVEDAAWQVLTAGAIDGAFGDALDQIGGIVLQPRAGLTDTTYRSVLRAAILANRSNGTGDQLLAILALLLPGAGVHLTEYFPAALVADPAAPVAIGAGLAADVLRRARSAGVTLHLVDYPVVDVFRFATGEFPELDAARGFGDVTGAGGAPFVGVQT